MRRATRHCDILCFIEVSISRLGMLTLVSKFLPQSSNQTNPSPPTDPPPAPPPLNLPPSRARRQLAARLALHSQQKADASSHDQPSTSPVTDIREHDDPQDDDSEDEQNWSTEGMSHGDSFDENQAAPGSAREGLGGNLEAEPTKKPSPATARHLDLDDFANSPAADADDAADDDSGEDIEMRVTLG